MKYFIHNPSGSVYWREAGEIRFSPLCKDGTFDSNEGGIVETWDETEPGERQLIESSTLVSISKFGDKTSAWESGVEGGELVPIN